MKKKSLKSLHVHKTTISNLNQQAISGGDIIVIITLRRPCPIPVPQATVTTCSRFAECDSMQICTAAVCKTNELDANTRPIC
ncbi:hypothetical protein U8527_10985 [Kordia algicida OT-1]|uniref:hypothetical protein n=1 Tax=Kordia algicida TaxID=221066 RepID=UPI00058CB14D|nr:hypothetical protein [Kordia algicida]